MARSAELGRLGMLGGGQLGRMTALAAARLGVPTLVYDPAPGGPAALVAAGAVAAAWDDEAALAAFAARVDAVTVEFENIPAATLDFLAARVPVRPGAEVLRVCQNRRREKEFLARHGFPHAPWALADGPASLAAAVDRVGRPCVLKTAAFGYDGKGQVKITAETDLAEAWARLGGPLGTVEGWVEFAGEYSVLVARDAAGQTVAYPVVRNLHTRHILDLTLAPGDLPPPLAAEAAALARAIAGALALEGLLAVELFLTRDGRWLVNELAPRPHNSGHWTQDGAWVSQFEQHARVALGLPLGQPGPCRPSAMLNLLGDLWQPAPPDWAALLREPGVRLHLYGKAEARPGRKMGHLNVVGDTPAEVRAAVRRLRAGLGLPASPEVAAALAEGA